jgi:dCMP deaminase
MNRLSNDNYYLSLLPGVAARATCVRRQVGAIIVDHQHRVLSMGFNGVPRGFPHCGEVTARMLGTTEWTRDNPDGIKFVPVPSCDGANEPKGVTDKCLAVHAEINALLSCADLQRAHTMYVSCTPCRRCALTIANTNIKRIVCLERYADDAEHILRSAGINLTIAKSV